MIKNQLLTVLFTLMLSGAVLATPAPTEQPAADKSAQSESDNIKSETPTKSLTLVVDNYPPYIDEQMSGQGVLTQLVVAAFQSQGIATQLQFKPWHHIQQAAAVPHHASFLWFKDKDLEQDWLFSAPIVQ